MVPRKADVVDEVSESTHLTGASGSVVSVRRVEIHDEMAVACGYSCGTNGLPTLDAGLIKTLLASRYS